MKGADAGLDELGKLKHASRAFSASPLRHAKPAIENPSFIMNVMRPNYSIGKPGRTGVPHPEGVCDSKFTFRYCAFWGAKISMTSEGGIPMVRRVRCVLAACLLLALWFFPLDSLRRQGGSLDVGLRDCFKNRRFDTLFTPTGLLSLYSRSDDKTVDDVKDYVRAYLPDLFEYFSRARRLAALRRSGLQIVGRGTWCSSANEATRTCSLWCLR